MDIQHWLGQGGYDDVFITMTDLACMINEWQQLGNDKAIFFVQIYFVIPKLSPSLSPLRPSLFCILQRIDQDLERGILVFKKEMLHVAPVFLVKEHREQLETLFVSTLLKPLLWNRIPKCVHFSIRPLRMIPLCAVSVRGILKPLGYLIEHTKNCIRAQWQHLCFSYLARL